MKLNNAPKITGNLASLEFNSFDLRSYLDYISIRSLPTYKVTDNLVEFPANYVDGFYQAETKIPLDVTPALFDYQKVIAKVAFIKQRYGIFLDPGLGKCHGIDTPIIMYDGSIKTVQDIQAGEQLLGPDSKPRNVLSTTRGYGPLYKVTPIKGEPFVCNDAHILSLKMSGTKKNSRDARYVHGEITNISVTDYLSETQYFREKMKLWRTGVNFENNSIECDAYVTGIWLGDGTVGHPQITTNDNDIEVIQYLKSWTEVNELTITDHGGRGCLTRSFVTPIGQPNWFRQFVKTLYVGNEKRIPAHYLINDTRTRLELLAGLLDSDAYFIDNCYEIVTKYSGLADDIAFLARSLGLGVTRRLVVKGIKSSGFIGKYHKLLIYGETDKIPTKLPRKQSKPRKQVKDALVTGFKIEYLGEGDYYGFTLDNDHLYLLGDFTVTHNTFVLGELARQTHAQYPDKKILYVTALNILTQSMEMCHDFFPDFPASLNLHNSKLSLKEWALLSDEPVAFINHEAFIKLDTLPDDIIEVLLDEASILKGGQGGNGKIAKNLISACKRVKYRYAASGTPAPNDKTEYAMIALWLGYVNSEKEFYSMYFVNKDGEYQLRRHATEKFYQYLASWSIFMRSPASYGFENNLKDLLPWKEIHEIVEMTPEQTKLIERYAKKGKQAYLPGVAIPPSDMGQRSKFSQISKGFVYNGDEATTYVASNKPQAIYEKVKYHAGTQVLIWTVFDEEGDILERKLKDEGYRVAHITGKTKPDTRLIQIDAFRHGELDVIISKPRILGFGLNFQFCYIEMFSGLSDSYEQYFQAVKRVHRYGQKEQVLIYLFYTPYEEVIIQNVLKKQKSMEQDFAYQERLYINSLADELKDFLLLEDYIPMEELQGIKYEPILTPDYQLYHGDSIKMMLEIRDGKEFGWLKPNSVDLSVFSPPFPGDVFTYSRDPADMGNTRGAGAVGGMDDFMLQFQFFLEGMKIVTKPGRIMAMHLEDIPFRKGLDGYIGIYDVVGEAIRQATKAGWILIAKIPIVKNQQMQAIMKKISSLTMTNMEHDRLRIAPANNGYMCLFKKPGEADIRVANLAKCNTCGWQGYADDMIGWQAKRGYKSQFLLDVVGNCPKCESSDILSYSEMDGNKWIICAEGVWPDGTQFDDFDKMSKISRDKRWYENVFQTALGTWFDVLEPDVLRLPYGNDGQDREDSDKHLCPLPLTVIQRPIEMYTLPGELVFTPFSGSGTALDRAIRAGRKVVAIELKDTYFRLSATNAEKAIAESQQLTLFDLEALKV